MTDPLGLETRDGLPDALRVLVREYPRTGWHHHENFTGMVQFWMDRHTMFRRLLNALELDLARHLDGQLAASEYAPRLSRYGGHLLSELHMHHQIEDQHYFPMLMSLDERISSGFDLLERDHQQIDGFLSELATRANAVIDGAEAGELNKHLTRMHTALDRHLTDEEDLVVPVVLASGFDG